MAARRKLFLLPQFLVGIVGGLAGSVFVLERIQDRGFIGRGKNYPSNEELQSYLYNYKLQRMLKAEDAQQEPEYIRTARHTYDRGLRTVSGAVGTAVGAVCDTWADVKEKIPKFGK